MFTWNKVDSFFINQIILRRFIMKLKKILPIVLSTALMLNFSACNKNGQTSLNADSSKIVATVGEESISAVELKFYLSAYKEEAEEEAGLTDKSDDEKKKYWESEEGKSKKQEVIDIALENIKELKILLASAKKDNISLDELEMEYISQALDQFIKEEANGDVKEANKIMIRDYGVTIDQYRALFTDFILAYQKYAQIKPTKIEISESDIQKEFENNKDQYEKVTVQHILFKTINTTTFESLSEDEIAKKKSLAEEVLKKAQSGEKFEDLVKQYTEDDASKDTGGEYTFTRNDDLVDEFKEWSFNAKEGDMDIVETYYGYHVMKFVKRTPPTLGDEEKAEITSTLQADEFQKMIDNLKAETQLVKNQEVIDSLDLF